MAMSIESALQLEVFSRVAVTVHAGQRNLDRLVRWVHPTEIPDIAQFLSGGEMLLTAGLGIGDTQSGRLTHRTLRGMDRFEFPPVISLTSPAGHVPSST